MLSAPNSSKNIKISIAELWLLLTIFILSVLLSVTLSGLYSHFYPIDRDTASYLFQAKLFSHGCLSAKAPPDYGFTASPQTNINDGKWYSKYPFGNALMLTLGVFIGMPWLIPPLLTGLTLVLLYLIMREVYNKNAAILSILLGLISPSVLIMGATIFSENVSRFYLAIYLFTLIKALKNGCWFYAMLSGFALGYAFNTRPCQALIFGLSSAGMVIYRVLLSHNKGGILKLALIFLISLSVLLGADMMWNFYLTGNLLKSTFNFTHQYDKLGFGKRSEGIELNLKRMPDYSPNKGIIRTWLYALPSISSNTLGWGYYLFSRKPIFLIPIAHIRWKDPLYKLRLVAMLLLPFVLMLIPIFHPSRNYYDVFFLTLFLLTVLVAPFYFVDISAAGITPLYARYYNECMLLGIIPLITRGIVILYERIKRLRYFSGLILFGMMALFLSISTIYCYAYCISIDTKDFNLYCDLPKLVEKQKIHHSVIFIPGIDAPLGDYPFKNLDDIDIIYFKLGPSKDWRLTNSDWHMAYIKYFQGRQAYMLKLSHGEGYLLPLQPAKSKGIIQQKTLKN